jgi:hypothetical protein
LIIFVSDETISLKQHKDIRMKKSLLKGLATVVIIITALTACNSNHKKQITGSWQVVDAKFESKTHIDPELLSYSVTEMKTWIYTFNADSTMNVKQTDRDIPNRWKLNAKGDTIIIGFGTGFFDVPSKIEKLTDQELVMRTTLGSDTARVTQILYLKKETK